MGVLIQVTLSGPQSSELAYTRAASAGHVSGARQASRGIIPAGAAGEGGRARLQQQPAPVGARAPERHGGARPQAPGRSDRPPPRTQLVAVAARRAAVADRPGRPRRVNHLQLYQAAGPPWSTTRHTTVKAVADRRPCLRQIDEHW